MKIMLEYHQKKMTNDNLPPLNGLSTTKVMNPGPLIVEFQKLFGVSNLLTLCS
jgi:hypothetical protein